MSIKIVIDEEDGANFLEIGETPDDNEESWDESDQLYEDVIEIIKANYQITTGSGENCFIVDGNEFKYLRGEENPLSIYAYASAGNEFIKDLAKLLDEGLN